MWAVNKTTGEVGVVVDDLGQSVVVSASEQYVYPIWPKDQVRILLAALDGFVTAT